MPITYADAGVDIDAANRAKARIKQLARATFSPNVLTEIGGFGGLFALPGGYRHPVLVSSIDGVGTKLKIAFLLGRHDSVGRDLVNHCVNDILVQGARPLFFLDYLATGVVYGTMVAAIVAGISRGCRENGCALIGGETAEMPGFYNPGEYDLAGAIIGISERDCIITGAEIKPGDRLIGLRSAGLHTNGYSLARKLLFETAGYSIDAQVDELGVSVGDELLKEHRSYLRLLEPLLPSGKSSRRLLHGMAHITGGGITENVPRILPKDCAAEIDTSAWEPPPIFRLLQRLGDIPADEMRRTFNLGIGMVLVVAREHYTAVAGHLRRKREDFVDLGRIVEGRREVLYTVLSDAKTVGRSTSRQNKVQVKSKTRRNHSPARQSASA